MYRVKDFKFLEVFNSTGEKIGEVQDIAIDYFEAKVVGLIIPRGILKKNNFIAIKDIISFGEKIIVKNVQVYNGLKYDNIKDLDVINKRNKMIGILEELIIDENFNIRGLIVSKGFFDKFINGKYILLLRETILGEGNILHFGNGGVSFVTRPHNLWKGE